MTTSCRPQLQGLDCAHQVFVRMHDVGLCAIVCVYMVYDRTQRRVTLLCEKFGGEIESEP